MLCADQRALRRAGSALGLQLRKFEARGAEELNLAFAAIVEAKAGALLVLPDATLLEHRAQVIALATRNRLIVVYGQKDDVAAGGLMSYGPDMASQYHRGAAYVDKSSKEQCPGPSCPAADQVRTRHQSQDRQGARHQQCQCQCCSPAPTR